VKIQTAGVSTGVIEVSFRAAGRQVAALRAPDGDLPARHLAQNARSWEVLERLGVREGAQLALAFRFESAGPAADLSLADHLSLVFGYAAEVEADGVSGCTTPMQLSLQQIDDWVASMLRLGAFRGWTATVRRPR
jgi:hypothetical protein